MPCRFVKFHYVLRNSEGKILDSSHDGAPMMFLEGVTEMVPGLEQGLRALSKGERSVIPVRACDGYGSRDGRLIVRVPISKLRSEKNVTLGSQFTWQGKGDHPQVYRVTELTESHATLDGNHPLAGQDLLYEVEVIEARLAIQGDYPESTARARSRSPYN